MIDSRMRRIAALATLLVSASASLAAQDLEPRAYSASPIGTTFVVAGVARSTGSVLTDPTLPFEDINARLGVLTAGVGYTFDLLSRTALIVVAVTYRGAVSRDGAGEHRRGVARWSG